jgi:hypothetical protein
MATIKEVAVERDEAGNYKSVRLVFGPHYFAELIAEEGRMTFRLGATHHGFQADASEVDGELEKLIYEIRDRHPETMID